MFCLYCKTQNPELANFCYECGNPFNAKIECTSLCEKLECNFEDVKNHLQTILNATLDAIILTNNMGNVIYWNNAATKIFGYKEHEIIGKNLGECVIASKHKEKYYQMFKDHKNVGSTYLIDKTVERDMIRKNGCIFTAEISFSTIKIKGSDFIIGIVRDVSERKNLEEKINQEKGKLESSIFQRTEELNLILRSFERANDLLCAQNEELLAKNIQIEQSKSVLNETFVQLEKSERYYRNLFKYMNEGVVVNEVIYDDSGEIIDFRVTDVNPAFEAITGISKEKAVGSLGSELYNEKTPHYLDIAKHVVNTRETIYTEIYRPYIDKYIRSGFFSPEKDKFALVFNDITEQKKTVDALNMTQFSVDNSAVGIAWVREDASFMYVNNEFAKLTGYSKDELLQMHVYDIDDNFPIQAWKDYWLSLSYNSTAYTETTHVRKDGTTYPATINANYFEYKGQNYLYASIMDVTERKKSEQVQENFIATLSHDLRVPLLAENKALKYLSKGSYGELSEKQLFAVNNMIHSNNDLLNLVNTLLDVYKYDSEEVKVQWEEVNLNQLVNSCLIDILPLVKETKKTINSSINEDFECVKADRKLIMRVLINLLSNAISYSNDCCTIDISAKVNSSKIIISVSDNGIGISDDEKYKIFDRYYTCSKKFRKVGTGLGLYLSRQIITAHGGDIWAESELDKGSTFFFTLPRL